MAYAPGGTMSSESANEQVAGRVPHTLVAGSAQTVVVGVHDPDPWVPAGDPVGEHAGGVGGPVVDHDDLERRAFLAEHAAETLLEIPRDVVRRDHDAEEGGPGPSSHGPAIYRARPGRPRSLR